LLRLKAASEGKNRSFITRLMLQEFYLFYPTVERQVAFITSLSDNELQEFIRSQTAPDRREKEAILYELSKKDHLVQKYETSKNDFAEIFKSKSTLAVGEAEDADLIGNLLLGEVVRVDKETLVVKGKYE
jgi:hypothetical protein